MIGRIAATAVVGLLLTGQAAFAAENARLSAVTGSVMINQGGRLAPASKGAVLRTGDRVVASNGSAQLVYADGCNVAITARSMATVSASSPCAGGSSNVVKAQYGYGGGSGGGGDNRGPFYYFAAFGIATAIAVPIALRNNAKPESP